MERSAFGQMNLAKGERCLAVGDGMNFTLVRLAPKLPGSVDLQD
jgi:hypothetical protein